MNEFNVVGLYEHNAESYRKVIEAFKENNVVGIVHATGTGKSYNALQLAYDNKDLKTLWLVPSNAIKEHILKTINDNPNLNMNRDFPNLELKIYPNLVKMNTEELAELDTDLLILDEFHHTGALVWGARVNTLIDTHPDIKVFGMTAYTVRDRGTSYERDMALDEGDELFSNNIVSRYDLCDAMIDGVLPKPVYKSSYIKLIDMVSQLEERVKKLEASGRECSEYNKILNDVKKRIHEAPSLGEVVKQNVKKNGKYIYFCPPAGEEGTNDIETIKKEVISWFKEIVPEEDIVIYTSLSEMEDGGKSNRDAFYDDLDLEGNKVDNKLRVMFAINQYNEGVHAPNLDGVIMGRGTCSDIVFFEQLGRALSVSSGVKEKIELYNTYSIERLRLMCSQKNINYNYDMNKEELIEKLVSPVIIDLAGNIDFIRKLEDNLKDRIKEYQEKGNGILTRRFLSDASFDLDMYELDLFNTLMDLKKKTEMTWDDWYNLAEEYYKEHGNLDIPAKFISNNGKRLGQWLHNQKTAYKNHKLTKEKIDKLELIGIIWYVLDNNWNEMYELAKKYFEKYGNLEVPARFKTNDGITYDENGKFNLGVWINHQRIFCDPKSERGILLSEIGMRFEKKINKISWDDWYKYAKKYYEEHGNLDITSNETVYDDNGKEIKLGTWVHNQREAIKKGKLTEEQINRLKLIGKVFNYDNKTLSWDEWYINAEKYFKEHGNLEVSRRFVTNTGYALGDWIFRQRKAYRAGKLTQEQINKLETIGMRFENDRKVLPWENWYKLAKEYYEKHGNLEVPSAFKTSDGFYLGGWIFKQRENYKKGTLSIQQIEDLETIGMRFGNKINKKSWNEMYQYAKNYFEKHDNLEIPVKYSEYCNGELIKLGAWIHSQRTAYKEEKLNEKQVQLLESIRMIWDAKKNKSDIENLCKEHDIDIKKNKDIINHISFTEFKFKSAFLKDNGISVVDENGMLHEIFSMSSMNMKLKYGISLEDLVNMYGKEKNK